MGSGLEEDIGGSWHSGGEKWGCPDPQNSDPAQRSWEPDRSPRWQEVICLVLPWPAGFEGEGRSPPVPSLWEGWGSPDNPIPRRVRGFNMSERSGAPQREEPKPISLWGVELRVLGTSLG